MPIKIRMEDNIEKKEKKQKDDSTLFSTSLVFDQNINKIWFFIRDLKNETKTIDYLENLKYIKGDNTWIQGNVFTFNWIGLMNLKFKCIYLKEDRNKKIIKWKAKGDIGLNYYRAMYLYRITDNNKTLVKCIVSLTEKDNGYIDYRSSKNYYSSLEYNILIEKSKYLNSLKEDVISYESCIINKNYLQIWKNILNLKKMSEIAAIIGRNIEFNDPEMKAGSFLKFNIEYLNITIFMKIVEIKIFKKRKLAWLKLETIGEKFNKILKSLEYKITSIDNNKTQFAILHIFPPSNNDSLNKFKIDKKEIIKKFKKYIEENENEEE